MLRWIVVAAGVVQGGYMAFELLATRIAAGAGWAWPVGIVLVVGTLWHLVPGTVISVLVLALLLTHSVREALGRG